MCDCLFSPLSFISPQSSIKFDQYPMSQWMRVTKQHPHIPVPTDESHLRGIEAHLVEPANGFVPQVVEVKIINPSSPLHALPCKTECI